MRGKYRGCLIGGAIGNALGYPIESLRFTDIQAKYGNTGLTNLSTDNTSDTHSYPTTHK